jgi:hypothetical protein
MSTVHSLTTYISVLFEKPVVPQIISEFPAFDGTRRFVACSRKPAICDNGWNWEIQGSCYERSHATRSRWVQLRQCYWAWVMRCWHVPCEHTITYFSRTRTLSTYIVGFNAYLGHRVTKFRLRKLWSLQAANFYNLRAHIRQVYTSAGLANLKSVFIIMHYPYP